MLDRILDPLVEFNVHYPATKTLIGGPERAPQLATATQPLQDALSARVGSLIELRKPGLPEADRDRAAFVVVQIVRAMMPAILAAEGAERAALAAELKRALGSYPDFL